jgi:hypothetical protein
LGCCDLISEAAGKTGGFLINEHTLRSGRTATTLSSLDFGGLAMTVILPFHDKRAVSRTVKCS